MVFVKVSAVRPVRLISIQWMDETYMEKSE